MKRNILFVGLSFVAFLLILLYYFTENNAVSDYNLSRFFTIFVMLQFWNISNAKAFASGKSAFAGLTKNLAFLMVAAIILIGQILIVQFGGAVFRTVPISFTDWLLIIGTTSLVLVFGELGRLIKKDNQSAR